MDLFSFEGARRIGSENVLMKVSALVDWSRIEQVLGTATRIAGIPELVKDGTSGFVVPPSDAEALACRLADLLDDPASAVAMGAAGRAKVAAEYDIAKESAWLGEILAGRVGERLRPEDGGENRGEAGDS